MLCKINVICTTLQKVGRIGHALQFILTQNCSAVLILGCAVEQFLILFEN